MAQEHEPTIKIWLAAEVPARDADLLIKALASSAIDETLKLGQGEFSFVEELEKETLKHTVSVEAGKRFYNLHYQAKNPSPIMTTIMHEIGKLLPDDDKSVDEKGRLIDMKRSSWDRETTKISRGESSLAYKPKSEKRAVMDAFNEYLPKIKVPNATKKGK